VGLIISNFVNFTSGDAVHKSRNGTQHNDGKRAEGGGKIDTRSQSRDGKVGDCMLDNDRFYGYDGAVHFWFRLPLRTRLGVIATIFLTAAIVLLLSWYYDPVYFSYRTGWVIRFGPLVFFLWIAWGDLEKIPWWNWLIILIILIICSIKPSVWFVGVPIIAYILFGGRKKR